MSNLSNLIKEADLCAKPLGEVHFFYTDLLALDVVFEKAIHGFKNKSPFIQSFLVEGLVMFRPV
jgi:hypothetical protein